MDPKFPEAPAWIDYAVKQYQGGILIDGGTTAPDAGRYPDAVRAGLAMLFDPRYVVAHAGPVFVEELARAVAIAEAHYGNGATPSDAAHEASTANGCTDPKRLLACATYFRARNMWDGEEGYRTAEDRRRGDNLTPLTDLYAQVRAGAKS